jgi:chromosome segregation ATPase
MEQITVRLQADTLAEIESEADEQGQSRSDYIRDVLGSRNESAADVEGMREEIDRLEREVAELERELRAVRSDRDELRGELRAKQDHIASLESTRAENQQIIQQAVSGSVIDRVRSALGSGSDED